MSNPLPPEVLALLGDDATPERAIASFTAHRDESHPCADVDSDEALALYHAAIAAAAIRLAEATSDDVGSEGADGSEAWLKALQEYRALRNWRKP